MGRASGNHRWAPLFVLAAALLATLGIGWQYAETMAAKDNIRFRNEMMHSQDDMNDRMQAVVLLLRGAAGLFAAKEDVTREQFHAYAGRVGIPGRYPAILGIGWSRRLAPDARDAVVAAMRAGGQPDFQLWPAGERDEYHAILYLEPLDRRNRTALGYDMFTEPTRHAAMERAREIGLPAASARVTLVQEIDAQKQPGFLIYVPVFRGGAIPETPEERRARLVGYVYSPLRAGDLFSGLADGNGTVNVAIYDGPEARPENLLYRSAPEPRRSLYTVKTTIQTAGRPWTLVFSSTPVFESQSNRHLVPAVFVIGILLSLMLAAVTWAQARARRRADENAESLRRSRAELATQREWFRTTLASIGDAVIATDLDGRIAYINRVAETLTGWDVEEACGEPLQRVFRTVHDKTREALADPLRRVLQGAQPLSFGGSLLLARDGTERPVEDSAAPILDAAGRVTGVVLVFRDVTERQRAEGEQRRWAADLKRAQERLHMALDAARMAVWEWSIPDRRVWESEEMGRLFGRLAGDTHADYESFLAQVRPEDRERLDKALSRALTRCEDYEAEYRAVWPDGSEHWLSARGKVVCDDEGHPLSVVGVTLDISERKRAEDALRDAARAKDVFLATLAHELRNPLATISNALNVMKIAGEGGAASNRMRHMAERQMEQLVRLVDDLLEVSRITQGKIRLQKELVELSSIVDEALEASRAAIAVAGHHLTVDLDPHPLYLEADRVRITQVVANLLNNAAKYTRQNGEIRLTTRGEAGMAVISVRDNGIGIAPDMLPRIFDLFMQVDSAPGCARSGMGIGLTLVKNLVEMHHGTVEARSAGVGQGSEFIVRLPLVVDLPQAVEQHEEEEDMQPRSHARRVLVVDDNQDSAESIGMLLQFMGNEVEVAHDGPSAIDRAGAFDPDVVLLDIGLPGMDGYEVARVMKQRFPAVVLAAMTGWGGAEDRRRAQESGFDHHLLKPVDMNALDSLLAGAARSGSPRGAYHA